MLSFADIKEKLDKYQEEIEECIAAIKLDDIA